MSRHQLHSGHRFSPRMMQGALFAFTLIELLVVVAIISLLCAILMPALSNARRNANDVKCLVSLRQIGTGLFMYAQENADLLPPGEYTAWDASGDSVRWFTLINPYLNGTGNTWNTTIGSSLGNASVPKVFKCAAAPYQSGYLHFTCNPIIMPRKSEPKLPRQRFADLGDPARIVLIMDGVQNTSGNSSAVAFMMDSGSPFWASYAPGGISASTRYRKVPLAPNIDGDGTPPGANPRWRHRDNNTLQVVYGDMHVSPQVPNSLTENNFFPTDWRSKP